MKNNANLSDTVDKDGNNFVHLAVIRGCIMPLKNAIELCKGDIVNIINDKNEDGNTPLDETQNRIAKAKNSTHGCHKLISKSIQENQEIYELLRKLGARTSEELKDN